MALALFHCPGLIVTATPETKTERRRHLFGACATVLGVTAVIFNRVVFAGEWLSSRDTIRVYMPLAKYWVDRVRQGEFPQWYPYDALGQPYVGMMLSAAFHPARLLYLLFPVEHAVSVNTLLCYPAAAGGTYLCARLLGVNRLGALFSGITFAFSGYLVGISNNLGYLMAISTMPWVVWAAERFYRRPTVPRLFLGAGLLALVCLGGETQTFVLTGGALFLLALLRTDERRWYVRALLPLCIAVVAVLLAAPQILPALEALPARAGLNPLAAAQRFSLHPLRLVELAFGPVFISENIGHIAEELGAIVDPGMNGTWVDSIALGMPTLALAVVAVWSAGRTRVTVGLAAVAAVTALLMLGEFTPVYGLFYRFVPIWSVFRYPEKLVPWFTFVVALAAGYAAGRALEDDGVRRRVVWALGIATALSALGALATSGLDAWGGVLSRAGVAAAALAPLSRWFVLHASGTAVATGFAAASLWKMRPALRPLLLLGTQSVLLIWYGLPLPQTVDLPIISEPVGFIETLRNHGLGTLGGPRVHAGGRTYGVPRTAELSGREIIAIGTFMGLEPDLPALFGIESSNQYLPVPSVRLLRTAMSGKAGAAWVTQFAPLYGTGYFVADTRSREAVAEKGAFDIIEENAIWKRLLLRARFSKPRAFVAWPRCARDLDEVVDIISRHAFAADDEALIECDASAPSATGLPSAGNASIRSYAPERVEVDVDAAEGALLVLNDAYYDGWSATLDGASVPILAANGVVRGVRLPAGQHAVVFTYRHPGLRSGLAVAAVTGLALIAAAFARRRRAPPR